MQVNDAITGADLRLQRNRNRLREILNLLRRAAETLFDDPTTPENEYTQTVDDTPSTEDIYERDILTAANLINAAWNATISTDYNNPNVTRERGDAFSIERATTTTGSGVSIRFYRGVFRNVERGGQN